MMKLYDYLKEGPVDDPAYSCSEKILRGADYVWQLGLDEKALKLASGFGGGMGAGLICGALTGGVMALSELFVKERAHESDRIKNLTSELLQRFKDKMGELDCTPLKALYRDDVTKCRVVILAAAEILDDIVENEMKGSL
jgi:C_GCAxxG_C_C family probable redox protein